MQISEDVKAEVDKRGRRVAGQDPAKRAQILDGAKRCFLDVGFDAASMNDITAAAGVSKGTLYVYFEDKAALLSAIIEREKQIALSAAADTLNAGGTTREALTRFGIHVTSPPDFRRGDPGAAHGAWHRRAHARDRPALLFRRQLFRPPFAARLPRRPRRRIRHRRTPTSPRASSSSSAWPRSTNAACSATSPPPAAPEQIDRVVDKAVDIFTSYYGRKP